jgi:hypothetical protein
MTMKHSNTFSERTAKRGEGELRFEFFCEGSGLEYHRMGFDQIDNKIPNFYLLHPAIRSLPDYLMKYKEKMCYIHVKGTNKIKLEDLISYSLFEQLFCTKDTPLYVAFCLVDGGKPVFKTLESIKKSLLGLEVKEFPSDGKLYFNLKI